MTCKIIFKLWKRMPHFELCSENKGNSNLGTNLQKGDRCCLMSYRATAILSHAKKGLMPPLPPEYENITRLASDSLAFKKALTQEWQ